MSIKLSTPAIYRCPGSLEKTEMVENLVHAWLAWLLQAVHFQSFPCTININTSRESPELELCHKHTHKIYVCLWNVNTSYIYKISHHSFIIHNYTCTQSYSKRGSDYNFKAFIWSARTERSMSLSVWTSDSHVTGNPFPSIHSCKSLSTVRSGFPRHSSSMAYTRLPVLSLRRMIPNVE